jgi:signal-transduction protein with cAMP-binding, CBS, and nucleotidyltransferase domain
MAQTIADVMTPNPRTLDARSTVEQAAQAMKKHDIGDVIVCDGDSVCGIVTDRDIAVRVVAEGRAAADVQLGDMCSKDLTTVSTQTTIEDAVALMRDKAVRRLPVCDSGRPVGVVTIGDLAQDRDRDSALASVSSAPPNT